MRPSCPFTSCSTCLQFTKALALTSLCVIICIITNLHMPNLTIHIITDRCTEVLNAIIFFPSYHEGKIMPIITNPIILTAIPLSKYSDPSTTPATTIVEECNSDDTGVGPSIAIGNQYLPTHNADFPNTATTTNTHNIFPSIIHNKHINLTSPSRLYITAATADLVASARAQKPINKKLITPIPSHLKK